MKLDNKVAVITGANGGLGVAVTRAFLDSGARVAGVAKNIQDSDFGHPSFSAFPGDLSTGDAARAVCSAVRAKFGRIDALVHLVGAFKGGQPVAETGDDVLPDMLAQGAGRILAIGSRAAVEPSPMVGAYSASKAALVSLVRTVALENKDRGITANIVLPGTMDTPANRTAMPKADPSKWVRPAQVAAMLVHLASDDASEISGAAIPILGGEL
jgi:NAD(P)-dependent dehydrogenase (short-subunit alcohol dehydrogenase family)